MKYSVIIKRIIDVLLSLIALIILFPIFIIITIAIRLTMSSPVLFRQKRPGYKGIPFEILKFRTMRPPTPDEVWFRTDAVRLTRVGIFLRKYSIDELPELWNVLKGEMSMVGPRPLLMEYLPKYTPKQRRRHDVRPGITGLAQVNGRQCITFSKRLEYDIWYVDHWSILLDLRILFKTIMGLFGTSGVVPGQDVDEVDDLGLSIDCKPHNQKIEDQP